MIEWTAKDDVAAMQKAMKTMPEVVFRRSRNAFAAVGEQFRTFHRLKNLRGRPGLHLRSGNAGMGGSSQTIVSGESTESLSAAVFFGPPANKYVRIHEYGGTIVPVRARFLRFQINGRWIATKRVVIPKRLGWFDSWDDFAAKRDAIFQRSAAEIVAEVAKS